MRLLTYREDREFRVGVVHGDQVLDLQQWIAVPSEPLPTTMIDLIAMGDAALVRIRQRLDLLGAAAVAGAPHLEALTLAAPIPRPRKNILCIGHNYAAHAVERGHAPPARPAVFTKAPTTVIGPYDPILIDPRVSEQIDWEGELGVVIGVGGRGIPREHALDHVFGYVVVNDVSARDIQAAHGGQFFLGKSLDGSCPLGPWIVTKDEIADPQDLRLTTRVNGVVKQDANTSDMIFPVAVLIEWLSRGMTLEPGDIISTGTPSGIGQVRTPPEFLRPGDVLETEVANVGFLRNPVAAWPQG
ncbi:MAG TPA: fumarylacetoacetate hydrolase family protein [Chloroflexia bacterium]|nr:fumarylacetoacetate hydrolase family protein [Chloroflexia bacterium]